MVGTDPVAGAPRFTFGSRAPRRRQLRGRHRRPLRTLRNMLAGAPRLAQRDQPGCDRCCPPGRTGVAAPRHGAGHRRSASPRPHPRHDRHGLLHASYGAEKRFSRYRDDSARGHRGRGRPGDRQQRPCQRRADPAVHPGHPGLTDHRGADGRLPAAGPDPRPALFTEEPNFVWAIIASLFIGNVMLLMLNVPLVRVWSPSCGFPIRSWPH